MIKLIGLQRLLILVVLLGLNAGLAAGFFLVVDPMKVEAQDKISSLDSQISTLRNKIVNVKAELKELKSKIPEYRAMEDEGFFQEQNRFLVGKVLEQYRAATKLIGFSFLVGEIEEINSVDAAKAGYRLINSSITVNQINAYLDTHVFALANIIDYAFPGRTRVKRIYVKRIDPGEEIDNDTLDKICKGQALPLVEATVEFDWLSLDEIDQNGGPGNDFRSRTFGGPRG